MIYRLIMIAFVISMVMAANGTADSASNGGQTRNSSPKPGGKADSAAPDIKIRAAVMWDLDSYDGIHTGAEHKDRVNHSELRRARLGIKTEFHDHWEAKLQIAFDEADGTTEIDDAYIRYTGWRWIDILAGQTKEPFGLEALTSSKGLALIERPMASRAFAPGRSPGLMLSGGLPGFTWNLGVFRALEREAQSDTYAATGRITAAPWQSRRGIFHLGASGSWRDYDGEAYEIEETAEVHTAAKVIDTRKIAARSATLGGLEAALGAGPLLLQAEYLASHVEAEDDDENADYDGYYIQAAWLLTGERRPYKKGVFGRVKPRSNAGALELAARYSVLDTRDNDAGAKAENATLGLNWDLNRHVRLMINYISTELSGGTDTEESSGRAVSARVQYVF